jgi:hypothetical protein
MPIRNRVREQRRAAEAGPTPSSQFAPAAPSAAPAAFRAVQTPGPAPEQAAPAAEQAQGAAPAGLGFHIGSIAIGPPAGVLQPKLRSGSVWVPGYPPPAPEQPANDTGLPDALKSGAEQLGGVALDDVRVHYGSDRPAQIAADAYAEGSQIHIGPGQERHLAHEAWHVVQQKQGRVQPTGEIGGRAVNRDAGLEREADQMGAQAVSAQPPAAAAPLNAPGQAGGAVLQGKFRVARKEFTTEEEVEDAAEQIAKAMPKRWGRAITLEELVVFLKRWATDKAPHGYFTSYRKLVETAVGAFQRARADSRPRVAPRKIRTGKAPRYKPSALTAKVKIEKLRKLRRVPSMESLRDPQISAFRDTSKMARIEHRDHEAEYSIGHTGNFLLGGVSEHTYKDLLGKAKTLSGYDDQQLAQCLIRALTGEQGVIAEVPEAARDYVVKILGLIQGPEFRRAGMNLVATLAALNTVISEGGDIFDTLRNHALFVASEKETGGSGGSMRSQFHRRDVDEEDEDFQQVAVNEFDSLMGLADANEVDTTDDTALETFFAGLTQTGIQGIQQQFSFSVDGVEFPSSSSSVSTGQTTSSSSGDPAPDTSIAQDGLTLPTTQPSSSLDSSLGSGPTSGLGSLSSTLPFSSFGTSSSGGPTGQPSIPWPSVPFSSFGTDSSGGPTSQPSTLLPPTSALSFGTGSTSDSTSLFSSQPSPPLSSFNFGSGSTSQPSTLPSLPLPSFNFGTGLSSGLSGLPPTSLPSTFSFGSSFGTGSSSGLSGLPPIPWPSVPFSSFGAPQSETGSSSGMWGKKEAPAVPQAIDGVGRVRDVSGTGMDCLIRAILLTALGSIDESVVAIVRRHLIDRGAARHGRMLDLANHEGAVLVSFLVLQGVLSAERGITVYTFNERDEVVPLQVVDGSDPITIWLSDEHFRAILP